MMVVCVQGSDDPFEPCESMASAIVEILKTEGECGPADLRGKGFMQEEIEQHWRMAYGLAKVELRWLDA